MSTKHFKITADASSTVAAGREVDRAFMRMARAAKAANGQFRELKKVPAMLYLIEKQATKTTMRLQALGFMTERTVKRMENSFKNAHIPQWWIDMASGKGGLGAKAPIIRVGSGGGGGIDTNNPRSRPLFGSAGSALEQGQAVQNAVMAMLPLVVPAALAVGAKYLAIEQRKSSILLENTLERAGLGGAAVGAFSRGAANLGQRNGGSLIDNKSLMGGIALAGVNEADRAERFGVLAKDIEAAGGSASEFVSALMQDGPAMAESLRDMAKELGIVVSESASVNESLRALNQGVGGLSERMNEAAEGWPQIFQTLMENLAMLGEATGKNRMVQAFQTYIQGEEDDTVSSKNNMGIGNNIRKGQFLFREGVNEMFGSEGAAMKDARFNMSARISREMQAGRITQQEGQKKLAAFNKAYADERFDKVWDMAYEDWNADPRANPVQAVGPRGAARPEEKKKPKNKFRLADDPEPQTLYVKSDPFSPHRMATVGVRGGR